MAVNRMSTDLLALTINGRLITDWGNTDPAYTEAPIDPKSTLRRGQGGNAVRLDRINPGRTVTLNLNPGGPDSAFIQSLINSRTSITLGKTQIGTLETAIGTDGVIVNDGTTGRAGQNISDDQYIIEFNGWNEAKGG